ncbi:hypothetical protein EVAR_65536_1 [Eumeta japonica]|uniref:Uncharacterized protein n=1 Tax=Eumeta variegata TaxID=151549 RepID=A0A4C1ZVC5_EUMVA|nr:hypothetical protein EVAR_65536_1 [Eumeta japonica]
MKKKQIQFCIHRNSRQSYFILTPHYTHRNLRYGGDNRNRNIALESTIESRVHTYDAGATRAARVREQNRYPLTAELLGDCGGNFYRMRDVARVQIPRPPAAAPRAANYQ